MKNLFKSKFEKYIFKKVLIFFIILAILDMVFIKARLEVLGGLFLGFVFSLFRLISLSALISKVISKADQKTAVLNSILRYGINLLILTIVLVIALKINIWVFAGALAGILLVPLVLVLYGIAFGTGVLKNKFD